MWWSGDPNETYWMEITQRDDVGAELYHYVENQAGGKIQSTPLLREMRRGDVVFHYHTPAKAIVGRSRVADSSAAEGQDQGWDYVSREVTDFRPLVPDIPLDALRGIDAELLRVQQIVEAQHGKPTWLPFVLHAGKLRPRTQYVAKVAAAMVPLIENATMPWHPSDDPPKAFDPAKKPTAGKLGKPTNDRERHALAEKAKQDHQKLLAALFAVL